MQKMMVILMVMIIVMIMKMDGGMIRPVMSAALLNPEVEN